MAKPTDILKISANRILRKLFAVTEPVANKIMATVIPPHKISGEWVKFPNRIGLTIFAMTMTRRIIPSAAAPGLMLKDVADDFTDVLSDAPETLTNVLLVGRLVAAFSVAPFD